MKRTIWILVGILLFLQVKGQRIFPGAEGFGTDSRGAYSGSQNPTVLIVDTLAAGSFSTGTNRGTFEWCLTRNFPRIILFEVGGVIDYRKTGTTNIPINQPYLTVYGQTAPDPGITLIGSNIALAMHDALFQHITIRYGDDPFAVKIRDCFSIFSGSHHIVIDHCSFSWSQDEVIGISSGTHDITVSNCIVAEPLVYSLDATSGSTDFEPRRTGYCFGLTCDYNVSLVKNLLAYGFGRNPPLNVGSAVVVNNFVYKSGPDYGIQVRSSVSGKLAIIGNVVLPTEKWSKSDQADYLGWVKDGTNSSTQVFLYDNISQRKIASPSSGEWDCFYDLAGVVKASASPMDISEYTILPADKVETYISQNAGARFWNRDYHDARIMNNVTSRHGSEINSPNDLPAKAYNKSIYEGLKTSSGNMKNGYNWSSNPQTIIVNNKSIALNTSFSNINDMLNYLNDNLPDGTEAVKHPHPECYHIIFQTNANGSNASITVSGNGLAAFGIQSGTYYGCDGVGGWPAYKGTRHRLSIPSDAHADNNGNGYTNLEDWVCSFGVSDVVIYENHAPQIEDQHFEIISEESGNLNIGVVSASDPDDKKSIVYQIETGNERNIFKIDVISGMLSFREKYSVVYPETFVLKIKVSDNIEKELFNLANITVSISSKFKTVYINPENKSDEIQNGSFEHPFRSWADVVWIEDYTYLQKAGTEATEDDIVIGSENIRIGSYGQGEKPVISSSSTEYAMKAFEKSKITINNLVITAPNAVSCIYFLGETSSGNIIENCVLEDAQTGIRVVDGKDITIRYNSFKNSFNAIYSYAENTRIYYNVFRNNTTAINILSKLSDAEIYNNVFYDNTLGIANSYSNLRICNNIFYLNDLDKKALINGESTPFSDNNLYYPEQTGFIEINGKTYNDLDDVITTLQQDEHSIIGDPLFVNALSGVFKVAPNSPAINAGRDVGLTSDFLECNVPMEALPDIGAYETKKDVQQLQDNENKQLEGIIYPNPSNGKFRLKISETLSEAFVEIRNLSGNIILSLPAYSNASEPIDISGFPSGLYLVSIIKHGITIVEKAVVK
ncbi:MAG: right-handed parallel beta-helix repeat-containing protein [Bacteroidales bacterium]|nr:right-handed parallel beta-helix repeat-containing protein [Bacteroidales bacterium]